MRAHEAGALHGNDLVPQWLPYPSDVNHLIDGLWSMNTTRNARGEVEIAGVGVGEIKERFGTPTFVIDEEDFRSRARLFRDTFERAFAPLSGVDMSYAGKAFLSTAVARWVHSEGLGLDVCSGGELAIALRAGSDARRLTFHGNNKSDAELKYAIEAGVGRLVLDSLEEIDRVSALAATAGTCQRVLLRVTSGVEAHTHEFISTAHEDQKFGISIATGEALEAIRRVEAAKALTLDGLHSHIGSQIFDTNGFEVAARRVLALAKEGRDAIGRPLTHIVLGGGFGVMYTTQNTPRTAGQLAEQLAAIVDNSCRALDLEVPRLGFEPGRAIAGPSTQTLYTVGTLKDVELGAGQKRLYVSIDGGMSDNIRTALYDADYSCLLSSRTSAVEPRVVRIVGKHCESGDIVVKDEYLPGDVKRGDLVSVPVTGAYCYALASNYNIALKPAVVSVKDGTVTEMIRRETLEDLLARDLG
ncbi:diaminopimelate decarboxylase [Dermabacter sp. HSID17554]|uniref:diaminopimelate decarboxylase n=1 Tax=Dermabacter sp. HSID17554 TaxID=2419511 RepID=UPI000F892D61|nr:diaminopimelate decarboxylase [Dermabacter sp. HSID17554]RUP87422.1 diaminopimelate decarboxylase [Dermabacter sp. HSID17554]